MSNVELVVAAELVGGVVPEFVGGVGFEGLGPVRNKQNQSGCCNPPSAGLEGVAEELLDVQKPLRGLHLDAEVELGRIHPKIFQASRRFSK